MRKGVGPRSPVRRALAAPRRSGAAAALAWLPPLAALSLQLLLWPVIAPYAWFLFYPAVFASSWIGGLRAGLGATAGSAALVWWFFIPPEHTVVKAGPKYLFSLAVFVGMGVLFSVFHDRFRKANARAVEALVSVRSMNETLQSANRKITELFNKTKELDALKTQFFANVSHELRTPLTLILGPAERLLASDDLGEEQRRQLGFIDRNARVLLQQVNDLLEASKLEAGKVELQYTEVDLAEVVRLVTGQFEVLAADSGITFRALADDPIVAHVDVAELERAVTNLVANALKFTPSGGNVRVQLWRDGRRAVVEVADSGPGVAIEHRDAIFERFHQVEGGATRRFGGTGLGLAIARDVVRLHGGTLEVTDAPEGGALFRVGIPLVAPAGAPVRAPGMEPSVLPQPAASPSLDDHAAAGPADGRDRPVVLVVEDNPEMNRFLCDSLAADYRAVGARDGAEGLAKALDLRPTLILCDVMMPELSGEEFVHRARHERELARTPIVMLTAKADDELRVRLLREGANDYVMKPFVVEELRARVDNLVGLELARAELASVNETMREFVAVAAHELRSPLAAIVASAEMLREDAAHGEEAGRLLEIIERRSGSLSRLVDDLLTESRIEAGALDPRPSPVCLRAAVEEVVQDIAGPSGGVAVAIPSPLTVMVDPDHFQRILTNYVTNALRYGQPPVVVSARGDGPWVEIRVRDCGQGVPEAFRPRLFTRFARFGSPSRSDEPGTGLGLSIVAGLAQANGGAVWYEPNEPRGSCFVVRLPKPGPEDCPPSLAAGDPRRRWADALANVGSRDSPEGQ